MTGIPDKQTIRIGGLNLEYVVAGNNAPNIVLINGAGGPIEGWHRVFSGLAALGRVIAYNRPGIGGSSKPDEAQTGERMLADLRALLQAVGLSPPYVLVGHSLGGLIANLYARKHPEELAGVVLLEATAPEDVEVMTRYETRLQRMLLRLVAAVFGTNPLSETAQAPRTVEQISAAPSFPPLPLVVLTGGKPALTWLTPAPALSARAAHQVGLATLSPNGRQVIATKSGHFPQFSEPLLVIDSVRAVIAS